MKVTSLALLCCSLMLCLADTAAAWSRHKTEDKKAYLEWRVFPIKFAWRPEGYRNSVPDNKGKEFPAIQAAFDSWSGAYCSKVSFQAMGSQDKIKAPFGCKRGSASDNVSVVVFRQGVAEWKHPATLVSVTTHCYNRNTGELWDADIELNARDFNFTVDPREEREKEFDIQSVVLHEVGHLLGVDVSKEPKAAMFPSLRINEKRRELELDDVNAVCSIYPNDAKKPKFTVLDSEDDLGGCSVVDGGESSGWWWLMLLLPLCLVLRLRR